MKKILAFFLLFAALIPNLMSSADERSSVTPALSVIANEVTVYKTGMVSYPVDFALSDFTDIIGTSNVKSVTVLTLPDENLGTLTLSGIPVVVNQVISAKNINNLQFVPKSATKLDCSFVFGVVTESGDLAMNCNISIISELNYAPTVAVPDNGYISTSTIKNVELYSRLQASDPENDSVIFRITSFPQKGTVMIKDRANGLYVYKPIEDFTGSDSFGYVAVDKYGNESQETTVVIQVQESKTNVQYCDLDGTDCKLAAMRLAEEEIYVGQTIAGKTYFLPDATITKAEFLAMTMAALDIKVDTNSASVTAFADDGSIPPYLKSYVAMAEELGAVNGVQTLYGDYFLPNKAITLDEAAYIIAQLSGMYDNAQITVSVSEGLLEDWAVVSMNCLLNMGLIEANDFMNAENTITKSQAAIMIYELLN